MRRIKTPDGVIHNFPDETPDAAIMQALSRHTGSDTLAAPPPPHAQGPHLPTSFMGQVGSSLIQGLPAYGGIAGGLIGGGMWALAGGVGAIPGGIAGAGIGGVAGEAVRKFAAHNLYGEPYQGVPQEATNMGAAGLGQAAAFGTGELLSAGANGLAHNLYGAALRAPKAATGEAMSQASRTAGRRVAADEASLVDQGLAENIPIGPKVNPFTKKNPAKTGSNILNQKIQGIADERNATVARSPVKVPLSKVIVKPAKRLLSEVGEEVAPQQKVNAVKGKVRQTIKFHSTPDQNIPASRMVDAQGNPLTPARTIKGKEIPVNMTQLNRMKQTWTKQAQPVIREEQAQPGVNLTPGQQTTARVARSSAKGARRFLVQNVPGYEEANNRIGALRPFQSAVQNAEASPHVPLPLMPHMVSQFLPQPSRAILSRIALGLHGPEMQGLLQHSPALVFQMLHQPWQPAQADTTDWSQP